VMVRSGRWAAARRDSTAPVATAATPGAIRSKPYPNAPAY
jgi:hypothetical protein